MTCFTLVFIMITSILSIILHSLTFQLLTEFKHYIHIYVRKPYVCIFYI